MHSSSPGASNNRPLIKVGFCVAYDWYFLRHALPLVYSSADTICLALDKDRISWGGERFSIGERDFERFIQETDIDGKIILFEEDFHKAELTPMQNEVRQRRMMAEKLGPGGWHIQLDCDEYFLNFDQFASYLRAKNSAKPLNVCCAWVTLYKRVPQGFLYVRPNRSEQVEFIQIATNHPDYTFGRRSGHFNHYTNHLVIHQSWARTDDEVRQKLLNWGHKNDFDGEQYFLQWSNTSFENYRSLSNFHPIQQPLWAKLAFFPAESVDDFIRNFSWRDFPFTNRQLLLKNNRWLARVMKLLRVIRGK